jgi:hypothetical protein
MPAPVDGVQQSHGQCEQNTVRATANRGAGLPSSHDAVIRFSDQGIGLHKKENQKRSLKNSIACMMRTARTIKGTGLGLLLGQGVYQGFMEDAFGCTAREREREDGCDGTADLSGTKGNAHSIDSRFYPANSPGKGLLDKAGCEEKESHSSRRG